MIYSLRQNAPCAAHYLVALSVVRFDTQQLVTLAAKRVHTLLQTLGAQDTRLLHARILPHAVRQDTLRHSSVGNADVTRLHRHTAQTTLKQHSAPSNITRSRRYIRHTGQTPPCYAQEFATRASYYKI
jgi:hypothetical protein